MDAWADVEGAIQSALEQRKQNIERLTALSAITILIGAVWLVWPTISSAAKGESGLLTGLGLPIIILIWGLMVQDLGIADARTRTRVSASATIAWPILLIIAAQNLTTEIDNQSIGSLLIITSAMSCAIYSKSVLRGGLDIQRFKSLMTGVGTIGAFSVYLGNVPDSNSFTWFATISVLIVAIIATVASWISGDENKALRKTFKKKLDELETRILILRSENAAVDQAASLIMTAREEGHIDPELGMKLLLDAEEDIERNLSLAGDVDEILKDARLSVEESETVAPITKKARKSFDAGLREIDLGSLREGEMLFRQAKKKAVEIIEWWEKAEDAINEAAHLLDGKRDENTEHLHEMLSDAKNHLSKESPKKAFEYAFTIPAQLNAGDDALNRAAEAVKEAERQLSQADGLDLTELTQRLEQATKALENGNSSQATGLADGIVRTINAERAAMDEIRRALRQKKNLTKQFENRENSEQWSSRLSEIEKFADDKNWTHAAALLEQMTNDLDRENKQLDETKELLDFVSEEWKVLRNQCEAASIKADDEERLAVEATVSRAVEAYSLGNVEKSLDELSKADSLMEKLRRRI